MILACGPDDWDNDGNPIHEQCKIDRDVMQAEALEDR